MTNQEIPFLQSLRAEFRSAATHEIAMAAESSDTHGRRWAPPGSLARQTGRGQILVGGGGLIGLAAVGLVVLDPHSNKCNASSVGGRRPPRRDRDRDAASDQCDRPAQCPSYRAGDPKQGRPGPRQLQGSNPSGLLPLEDVFGLQGDGREPMVAARLDRDHGRQAGSPRRD